MEMCLHWRRQRCKLMNRACKGFRRPEGQFKHWLGGQESLLQEERLSPGSRGKRISKPGGQQRQEQGLQFYTRWLVQQRNTRFGTLMLWLVFPMLKNMMGVARKSHHLHFSPPVTNISLLVLHPDRGNKSLMKKQWLFLDFNFVVWGRVIWTPDTGTRGDAKFTSVYPQMTHCHESKTHLEVTVNALEVELNKPQILLWFLKHLFL
jgi:hypothetical protein